MIEELAPEWESDEDAEGFYSDLALHGKAWICIGPNGRRNWLPLEEARAALSRPTASTSQEQEP